MTNVGSRAIIMSLFRNLFSCMTDRGGDVGNGGVGGGGSMRASKVKFGVPLTEAFKSGQLPPQLKDLLVYIAREGVAVTDLFRRPGNANDMKLIMKRLGEGRIIQWTDYNFYTLANVSKKFLLSIPGGIFGTDNEFELLRCLEITDDEQRIDAMHKVLSRLSTPVRQLVGLLFGIWFRMIYHTEVNAMSVEAVAKSVAGSIFHTCRDDPRKVERASKTMEQLITGFASAELFGQDMIQYFTDTTKTNIARIEKFKYEFRYPPDVPREKSARLFVSLLLEESRKHGFHIIKHEVSREKFESATTAHPRFSKVAVHQTSEKKTTVGQSACSIGDEDCNPSDASPPMITLNDEGESTDALLGATAASFHSAERDDSEGHARTSGQRSDDRGDRPSKSGGKPRFDSVRRKQAERLQKRSDWFLSPPAGVRTHSLVQLGPALGDDPESPALATSGPDILLSTSPQTPSDSDSEFCVSESLYRLSQPSSEPAIRRGVPGSMPSPSPGGEQFDDDEPTFEESALDDDGTDVATKYYVVERFYGPDLPPSPPVERAHEVAPEEAHCSIETERL